MSSAFVGLFTIKPTVDIHTLLTDFYWDDTLKIKAELG